MARVKVTQRVTDEPDVTMRPALSVENREGQIANLAMNLVEQRIRDGTATSQEVVYCLKLGSKQAQLEMELLESKRELARAQVESIEVAKATQIAYQEALTAIKSYRGLDDEDDVGDIGDEY